MRNSQIMKICKKLLGVVIIGLFFSNISYSKIRNTYYEELYDGCMIEAVKADLGYTITKIIANVVLITLIITITINH